MSNLFKIFTNNNYYRVVKNSMSTASTPLKKEPKLKPAQIDFIKIVEQRNLERVQKLTALRRRNNLTGLTIGATVLGIYLYSMWAVQQEKFLDDFNEPEKISAE